MKLDTAKKELELCCKELSKSGVQFDDKWDNINDVVFSKHGSGKGVPDIAVMGQIDPENPNGAYLQITIAWEPRYFLQPQLKVKPAKYNPQSGLSRKEFVENVFGLKFGANVFDTIQHGPLDFKDSDAVVWRPLSAPVCGIGEVQLFQGEEKKLNLISLCTTDSPSPKEKDEATAKTKCAKSLVSIAAWLGLTPADFETNEKTEDKTGAFAYKETTIESVWFKDGFQIEVRCGWSKMKDSGDILLTPTSIGFRILGKQPIANPQQKDAIGKWLVEKSKMHI